MKKYYSLLLAALLFNLSSAYAQTAVKVGTDAVYPPFEYLGEKGEILGIEPDLLRAIAEKQGLNLEINYHSREKWADTLDEGEGDVWASAFYQGPQWAEHADMSKPFMEAHVMVVVLDNEKNKAIERVEDLQGKKISVSKYYGQPMIDLAAQLAGSPENVVVVDTFFLSMREMFTGKTDAVLGANYVQAYYIKQVQDQKDMTAKFLSVPGQEARKLVFLVKKGNKDLLDKINKGIDQAKADGTIQKLQAEWLSAWQAVK